MSSDVISPRNMPENSNSEVPAISITPSRRVSISTPLRFTRTFSTDSIDSLERNSRVELRRMRIMGDEKEEDHNGHRLTHQVTLYPSACPHLSSSGRSATEPQKAPTKSLTRAPIFQENHSHRQEEPYLSRLMSSIKILDESVLGLTSYQQRLLQQCWPNIYGTGGNGPFATSIYTKLTARNANARQLLAKANGVAVFQNEVDVTALHAKVTVELIDFAIKGLDQDHVPLVTDLIQIGRSHKHLKGEGLNANTWDELGDAIVDSLRRFDSVRKHKELRRAWLALVAYLIDNMKQSLTRIASNYELSNHSTPTNKH